MSATRSIDELKNKVRGIRYICALAGPYSSTQDLWELIDEAYRTGRADERKHCKEIAARVRKALE